MSSSAETYCQHAAASSNMKRVWFDVGRDWSLKKYVSDDEFAIRYLRNQVISTATGHIFAN